MDYRRAMGAARGSGARNNERQQPTFDHERYRARHQVEQLINRLKQFRRIAIRYKTRAEQYVAMIMLAAILLWL
jgi:transposase